MSPIIASHLDQIDRVCHEFRVRALYVFGSAAHGTFEPMTSDLDFQVDLGEYGPGVYHRYIGVYEGLSAIFGRKIDLITVRSTGNDRFMKEVAATRRPVFVA